MKTYQIRLFPSKEQILELQELSDIRKDIWNKLLDIQHDKYEIDKSIFNKFGLNNMLPELKDQHSDWKKLNSKAVQTIATELYGSYQSFFRLIKKDKTARPPNKIENSYFHSLTWNQSGWIIKENNMIIINKILFEYKSNLNIKDLKIKEIRIKFVRNKWLCDLVIDEKPVYDDNISIKTKVLAIDLGLSKLGTGIDNKGDMVVLKNKSKKINDYYQKQIAKIQNKRSKTVKGSNRNLKLKKSLNKCYYKKNEQIKQALHIQSKKLANMNYNTIVVGDLMVKKLMSTEGVNVNKKVLGNHFIFLILICFYNFLLISVKLRTPI